MEFWLSQDDVRFQLPIPPAEFSIQKGNMNQTIQIENLGEVNILGQQKLATISLTSFFPAQEYSFCQYTDFPSPYECIEKIEKWRVSKKPLRLLITDTDVNNLFSIEDFSYSEKDGTGDVNFTLALKEYKIIQNTVSSYEDNKLKTVKKSTTRLESKAIPNSYTVKNGDTLWAIAKRVYGDGSKYTSIAEKNKIKNPDLIFSGQVLTL